MDLAEFKSFAEKNCKGAYIYDAGESKQNYSFDIDSRLNQALVFYGHGTLVLKGKSVTVCFNGVIEINPRKVGEDMYTFEIVCLDEYGTRNVETIYWKNSNNNVDGGGGMC